MNLCVNLRLSCLDRLRRADPKKGACKQSPPESPSLSPCSQVLSHHFCTAFQQLFALATRLTIAGLQKTDSSSSISQNVAVGVLSKNSCGTSRHDMKHQTDLTMTEKKNWLQHHLQRKVPRAQRLLHFYPTMPIGYQQVYLPIRNTRSCPSNISHVLSTQFLHNNKTAIFP